MLKLPKDNLIGIGRERFCYLHPHNDKLVIKVPQSIHGLGKKSNRLELKSSKKLKKETKDHSWFSQCYEFVDTDQGQGLICDCIRDANGEISKTIWDSIVYDENCDTTLLSDSARKLGDYLYDNQIFIFDLNTRNIAVQQGENGSYRLCLIDVKSRLENKEFIPVSRFSKYFAKKKLKRRITELLMRIDNYPMQKEELRLNDRQRVSSSI